LYTKNICIDKNYGITFLSFISAYMKQEITLESLYNLLSGVITKQEAFNSKMLEFKDNQESFNSHLEDRLDSIQEEERQNHNVTHRMIMQAF